MPYLNVENYSVYYEVYGTSSGGGIPLVMLHEGLGSVDQWKDLPQLFASALDCEVLVYDRIGYGKSSRVTTRNANYLHIEAEFFFPALMKHLQYDKVNVFGHSDGATLAILLAALTPNLLHKVVIEAPHVFIEEKTAQAVLDVLYSWENGSLKNRMIKYHSDKTDDMFYSWARFWSDPQNYSWNIFQEMESIHTPILFIQGELDHFGGHAQAMEIRKRVKGFFDEIWLDEVGHIPHFEAKEEVFNRCIEFYRNPHNS